MPVAALSGRLLGMAASAPMHSLDFRQALESQPCLMIPRMAFSARLQACTMIVAAAAHLKPTMVGTVVAVAAEMEAEVASIVAAAAAIAAAVDSSIGVAEAVRLAWSS